MAVSAKTLEACLIEHGGVSESTLEKAREKQREGKGLGDVLQEMGAIDSHVWARVLADHYGLPYVDRVPAELHDQILELVRELPINFAKRYLVLPIGLEHEMVTIATGDPTSFGPIDDVRLLMRRPVKVVVAPAPVINETINRVYDMASDSTEQLMEGLDEERLDLVGIEMEETRDLLEADDEAPIIRLVNSLLFQAVKDRASDIHIEPFERNLQVRFRIDGVLYDIINPPSASSRSSSRA